MGVAVDDDRRRVRVWFESTSSPLRLELPGIVRMKRLMGHFLLEARDGGSATSVQYQLLADPGGHLPPWLVNTGTPNVVRDTLRNLRARVGSEVAGGNVNR